MLEAGNEAAVKPGLANVIFRSAALIRKGLLRMT